MSNSIRPISAVSITNHKKGTTNLENELAKYDTWESYKEAMVSNKRCPILGAAICRKEDFNNSKTRGVGRETIRNFLGANWTKYMIENALSQLRQAEETQKGEPRAQTYAGLGSEVPGPSRLWITLPRSPF